MAKEFLVLLADREADAITLASPRLEAVDAAALAQSLASTHPQQRAAVARIVRVFKAQPVVVVEEAV